MAAVAYDVVALAIKCESAALNFPNLAHSFPRVKSSSSISDIRTTAVEAAEAFASSDIISSSSSLWTSFISYSSLMEVKVVPEIFLDEEEVFNMPTIIAGIYGRRVDSNAAGNEEGF